MQKVWQSIFTNSAKMIAINTGRVKMFPWEAALYAVGQIPGVSTTITIPDDVLRDCLNCRDAVLKLLGDSSVITLSECKQVIQSNYMTLLGYDEEFAADFKLLTEHIEEVGGINSYPTSGKTKGQ